MTSTIVGSTKINLGDHINWVFSTGAGLKLGFLIGLILGVGYILALLYFGVNISIEKLIKAVGFALFVPVFSFPIIVVIHTVIFLRLSSEQRKVTIEISASQISLCDAAGNKISTPWSQVRKFRETKNALVIYVRPTGSRWIPKRAFGADDIAKIRLIADQQLSGGKN